MKPCVLSQAIPRWYDLPAPEIVHSAFLIYKGAWALAASFGIDSAVLLDLATKVDPEIPIIFVDTGFLPEETHRYRETLESWFKTRRARRLNIHAIGPDLSAEAFERRYGRLWEHDRPRYHELTKLAPMRAAIRRLGLAALLYGMRRGQTAERARLGPAERPEGGAAHIYPLFCWSDCAVNAYLLREGIPQHPLATSHAHVGEIHFLGEERARECGLKTLALAPPAA
jgi:phosphoadenosine phosphosulfate reductase